eukprot:scaffold49786_cov25-Tisochrysis_lutea.AAC.1
MDAAPRHCGGDSIRCHSIPILRLGFFTLPMAVERLFPTSSVCRVAAVSSKSYRRQERARMVRRALLARATRH